MNVGRLKFYYAPVIQTRYCDFVMIRLAYESRKTAVEAHCLMFEPDKEATRCKLLDDYSRIRWLMKNMEVLYLKNFQSIFFNICA